MTPELAGTRELRKHLTKLSYRPFKLYVNQCEICEERKNPTIKKRHLLKSYVVGAPFERIATDIAGPFPTTKKGNRYILVVGDYFTKLTELYAMPDMKAETVADIIFRAWIKRYGCPIEIHSDRGRQYESDVFKEMFQLLEINETRTTPFHPHSDGMIERINRTVNDMLSKYIK
jgi:transposase InsO family protein